MIYIVDEDVVQLQALVAALDFLGKEVTQIENADDALALLSGAQDIELVLVDVMLGTRAGVESSFSRVTTQDFLITGLELAQRLKDSGNPAFPSKIAFLSMASRPHVVSQIREKQKSLGIKYFDKRELRESLMGFAKKVVELTKG